MPNFTERQASKIIKQLLAALAYLNDNKIIHRDINASCIWLDDVDECLVKLGGFGVSRIIKPNLSVTERLCHNYYSAPQVIREQKYTGQADMWSIGVLAYLLISGNPPFSGETDLEIKQAIDTINYSFPNKIKWGDSAKSFISSILISEESERLTPLEALDHEWICKHETIQDNQETGLVLNHLRNFNAGDQMKQVAATFLIQNLSNRSELEQLNKVFVEMDSNSNGTLERKEIMAGYQKIYGNAFSMEEVDQLFKKADSDESGHLEYSEWVTVTYSHWNLQSI
jgi:calcium-dependent protein kinase